MRAVRPRTLTHRGVVEASAFFFDASLTRTGEARRRILSLWVPGSSVYKVPRGWLLRLPAPRRVRCDQAPGLPLTIEKVPAGRALVGAPFAPEELRTLDPPEGAAIRLRSGSVLVERPAESEREDPAAWLDVAGFSVAAAVSLGAPPAEPHLHLHEPVSFDPRLRLRGVPPPAPELAEVLAALTGKKPAAKPRRRSSPVSLTRTAVDWLHGLRWSLRGWRRRHAAVIPATAMGPLELGIAGERTERRPPGPRSAIRLDARIAARFHHLAARLAAATHLSQLVGRRHAAYIQRLIEMFEAGDVREALRYAIPLDSATGEALRGLPLRLPSPRRDLEIRPEPGTAKPLRTAPDLYAELQRLYRAAFERLESQGHVEEAAFVLAEVLHAHEEAVAFLERHGRLRLAAEMAEARQLPPGLVVRQWFLAGDRQRALRIARRAGAFADAVTRLERSRRKEEAQALRLLWGTGLAEAGDYVAAVEAVWPVPEGRRLAAAWMDRAIDQGGSPAGRMLARKLGLVPEEFEETRDQVLNLLESWRAEGTPARLAFAETLREGPRTPATVTLARAAVRSIARDSGRFGARMSPAQFKQLVAFADDGALRADAPALPLPSREPWAVRETSWCVEPGPSDVGVMPACDAAFLPTGLTLVALGEAGVRLISRAGRTVAEFDQPAHRLVVSDAGNRALALARRGDAWRLARIDLETRRSRLWCDARLDAFAPDYDGALWFVAAGESLIAVDATSAGFDGPWGVPDLGRHVRSIRRSPARCTLVTAGLEPEVWTYELPSLFLRSRNEAAPDADNAEDAVHRHLGASPEGLLAEQWTAEEAEGTLLHVAVHGRLALRLRLPGAGWTSRDPLVSTDWIVAPVQAPDEIRVHLIRRDTGKVRAEVVLARAGRVALRLTPSYLTLADDRGRVIVLDLDYGQIRRDLRL